MRRKRVIFAARGSLAGVSGVVGEGALVVVSVWLLVADGVVVVVAVVVVGFGFVGVLAVTGMTGAAVDATVVESGVKNFSVVLPPSSIGRRIGLWV